MKDPEIYLSVSALARRGTLTKGAIYQAIKTKKLKAKAVNMHWRVSLEDYRDYLKMRYSRERSVFEGKPLHDNSAGEYSAKQAAEMLMVNQAILYHYLRSGYLAYKKKGAAYVIDIKDIQAFKEKWVEDHG